MPQNVPHKYWHTAPLIATVKAIKCNLASHHGDLMLVQYTGACSSSFSLVQPVIEIPMPCSFSNDPSACHIDDDQHSGPSSLADCNDI